MTKYILQAEFCDGNITVIYDDKGYMVEFAIASWNIQADGKQYVLENMGWLLRDASMQQFAAQEGIRCRKARIDLSFGRFWKMYGNARNKIDAERLWNKLGETARYYVLVNLKGYVRYCNRNVPNGYTQMYPDSYLHGHTQDNWDGVPDWTKRKTDLG